MKVVILAGGFGTRLSEYTKFIPKPMVKLNNKPIIYYIMKHFSNYGFKEFYIALGYKGDVIRNYFKKNSFKWKINLIETGIKTMTGGRIKKLNKYLDEEDFFMTYGDGLSDVNLKKLLQFHKKNKKALVTMTAVRPPARFGAIKIRGKKVSVFREKSKIDEGWINGGFFIMNKKFIDYIQKYSTYLEKSPLEKAAKKNQLYAFKHNGFWQCMDTKRDKDNLEDLLKTKKIKF
jgi:glucose-1-phosphate cytidylyltransferase|tara:strand:+ start:1287 stop:1982 length:696 start_codon:yes stop_codon:yes gene_type:complete